MAKRTLEPASDSESETGPEAGPSSNGTRKASKRARQSSIDDIERDFAPGSAAEGTAPSFNGAPQPGGDDQDDADFDSDGHDEELEAQMRTQAMKHPGVGEVATAGVVQSIECINFMCHKRLKIHFGPQINFVVGHNGSGKSAFLTALTIALGGKAASTGRAAGLRDFVRTAEGVTQAQIILKLLNKGPDAWRHDDYGDTITVTRTIQREGGGGGTKLSSTSGRVVASTRAELQAITDHWNIAVDNPINILTQDAARQFLSTSTPQQKYKLFQKGTLLSQLTDDYNRLDASKHVIGKSITDGVTALRGLRKEKTEWDRKWKDAQVAAEKADELETLEACKAWAIVHKYEESVAEVAEALGELEESIKETEEDLQKRHNAFGKAKTECDEIRDSIAEAENADEGIKNEIDELKQEINSKKSEMRKLNDDKRKMNEEATSIRHQMQTFQDKIDSESSKNESDFLGPRQRALDEMERHRQEAENADDAAAEAQRQVNSITQDLDQAKSRHTTAVTECQAAESHANRCRTNLENAQSARANPLNAYGRGMPDLINHIERESWVGPKPIGPLGRSVKVKDKRWCQALETIFGPLLNGFIIGDNRDKTKLAGLLKRFRMPNIRIYLAKDDPTFDPSGGEPDESLNTIYRSISIENKAVRDCLINEARIEASVLVEDRNEGNELMYRNPRNVNRCYSIDAFQLGGSGMRKQEIALRQWQGNPRLSTDQSAHIATCQTALNEARARWDSTKQQRDAAEADLRRLNAARGTANADGARYRRQASAARIEISKLEEDVQKLEPANIAHLEEGRAEYAANLENVTRGYASIDERYQEIGASLSPVVHRRTDLQAQLDGGNEARRERSEQESAAIARKIQAESDIKQRKTSLNKKKADMQSKEMASQDFATKVDQAIAAAKTIKESPEGLDITKSADKYEKEIKAIRKSIRHSESRIGMPLEETRAKWISIQQAYESNETKLKDLAKLHSAIDQGAAERSRRSQVFTSSIAIRARMNFIRLMAGRNFSGRLRFNHLQQRLDILVETQEAAQAVDDRRKREAKNLSGGEKSFSTVSFLLTLWESVGCPIRGLDEFDVFQDDEHRTASIKMLVDAAKSSNAKQYLFITPNPIAQEGPHIRIHRLSDPERGQTTLA